MRPPQRTILISRDEKAVGREAAERFACAAVRSVAERGAFYVAVPGGSSPRVMYEVLASGEFDDLIPWARTELFFTDERCVPPESDESNYRLVQELLLSSVPIPEPNIHRFRGEDPPEAAAAAYGAEIRGVLGDKPRLDLIVLGMGADTHTASLFPGSPALHETHRAAVANYVEKLGTYRLTLTFPVINNAENVMILAMGEGKSDALAVAFIGETNTDLHPVQAVQPTSGRLLWIVDSAAASKLWTPPA